MLIEWDTTKAAVNLRKHKVSLVEASTVFADTLSVTASDPDHSIAVDRFLTFGLSSAGRLLVVSHTDRGSILRIISARLVTRHERTLYEEG